MKILNESKEKLPISFLTDFISKSWEEVGYLKADMEAIKQSFSGTQPVEDLIQGLIDAYLVCIGQLELHIHDKKYIEFPEESGLKENLKEDLEITVNTDKIEVFVEPKDVEAVAKTVETLTDVEAPIKVEPTDENREAFEYFVDFEEPDLTQPKLTDRDLYNED